MRNIKVLIHWDEADDDFTARLEEFLLKEQAIKKFWWTATNAVEDLDALGVEGEDEG